jgi:hypothetical protein
MPQQLSEPQSSWAAHESATICGVTVGVADIIAGGDDGDAGLTLDAGGGSGVEGGGDCALTAARPPSVVNTVKIMRHICRFSQRRKPADCADANGFDRMRRLPRVCGQLRGRESNGIADTAGSGAAIVTD